jgi:hypothetical protein
MQVMLVCTWDFGKCASVYFTLENSCQPVLFEKNVWNKKKMSETILSETTIVDKLIPKAKDPWADPCGQMTPELATPRTNDPWEQLDDHDDIIIK